MAIAAQAGWTAAQSAVVIAATIAIVAAIVSATVTYALNQRAARRERLAHTFADALSVVEDYAEMPYRIRRRRATLDARHGLTEELSRLQSRLAYHQALLQLEAAAVAAPYAHLVREAKIQAGGHLQDAWRQPAPTADTDMSLGVRYRRDRIDAARGDCILAMRAELGHRSAAALTLPTATSDPPPPSP